MFGLLMTRKLEFLELEIGRGWEMPGSKTPTNALVKLRGMNLFAASAKAIEIAGSVLLPPPSPAPVAPVAPPQPAAGPPRPGRWLEDLIAVLADAAAGLRGFEETDRPFTLVAGEWNGWRARVAALGVLEAETALRGEIDRAPAAPHRQLPAELQDLWRRVTSWGPGRAATWNEFAAGPSSSDLRVLSRALASWSERLRLFFLYLGVELPQPGRRTGATPAPRREDTGLAADDARPPGGCGGRVRCDEADRSVTLDGMRIAHQIELAVFRFFRVLAEVCPDPISYRHIKERVPGLKGKHPTRDLRDRLPPELYRLVTSGKHGYRLELPARK
jgi:hypothetical protein